MKKEPKRFDMYKKPNKPRFYLRIVEFVAGRFLCLTSKVKVTRTEDVKKLKGPFLLLATHQSFADFPQILKGLPPSSFTCARNSFKAIIIGLKFLSYLGVNFIIILLKSYFIMALSPIMVE